MKRLVITALLLAAGVAHAQTATRVYSCPTPTAAGSTAHNHTSCPAWSWAVPPRADALLPLVGVCTTCNWNANSVKWKRPVDVTATERIAICTGAVPSDPDKCTPQSFAASSVLPPAPSNPLPTVTLSANPMTVPYLGTSIITWSSTNATACEAIGTWGGTLSPAGSQPATNLQATGTFGVRCTGAGGNTSRTLEIVVTPAPPPEMTLSLNHGSILVGETAIATWSSGNVVSCSSSWDPTVPPAGEKPFGPYAEAGLHDISVRCRGINPAYETMRAVTLTVNVPTSIVPACLPDEEDVIPKEWGGRGKVAWAKLEHPLGKLDYKATYFCPAGAGGTVQISYATDKMEVLKSATLGARYDKAAARARCETECIRLPAGPTSDEVAEWKAAWTVAELGVIGE